MSENVRKCGFSIPLDMDVENLKQVCKKLNQNYDEFDENEFYPSFHNNKHLNRWIVASDYHGKYGLIKVTDYQYESFDLVHSVSLYEMTETYMELWKLFQSISIDERVVERDKFKTFSMLYYNGSDEPFVF